MFYNKNNRKKCIHLVSIFVFFFTFLSPSRIDFGRKKIHKTEKVALSIRQQEDLTYIKLSRTTLTLRLSRRDVTA